MDWGPTSGALIRSPRRGPLSGLVLMPKVIEDAALSDRGDADGDTEMVNAEVIEGEGPEDEGGPVPRCSLEPEEVLEQVPDLLEENPGEIT